MCKFSDIHNEAVNAGLEAGEAHKPVPMIVGSPSTLFGNDIDPNKPVYHVDSGVCGFAWVKIRPARGKFVTWLKSNNIGRRDDYAGGYRIPCFEFGQSLEKKERYASAYARVLKTHGINAHSDSRMD
jgi:hypothetical protein